MMKENRSNKFPNNVEQKTRITADFRKILKVISSSILILALGLAVFLPFVERGVEQANAAPIPGVPIDTVTVVNVWETSQYQTPDDPTDDSIEYVPTSIGDDTFEYEICDTSTCNKATVTVHVLAPLAAPVESPQILSGDEINAPSPVNDEVTTTVGQWLNIDVLANDSWGGPPAVGPIKVTGCTPECTAPTHGTVKVNTGPRSPDPMGLAYIPTHPTAAYTNQLVISDSEVDEIYPPNEAAYTGINMFVANLLGALTSTFTTYDLPDIDISKEPTGVAYNPTNNHLYIVDDDKNRIFEMAAGGDGLYGTTDDVLTFFATGIMGSMDPSGVAYDSWHDDVIIVDEYEEEVYIIDLGLNGTLDQADTWTNFDVTALGIMRPEGVEFNPDNGHLYVQSSHWSDLIAETTTDGKIFRYLDATSVPAFKSMSGLAYIPQLDGSTVNTLYMVARGEDNNPTPVSDPGDPEPLLGDPLENDGKLAEVTFPRNAPPYVNAGLDQPVTLPAGAVLDGTVIDDGQPEVPGILTVTWSMVSGPGVVTFLDPHAQDTTANFTAPGVYVLKLEANDGGLHLVSDTVTITVNPAGNAPPFVDAGLPQIVTMPASANLDGTVTDDGLPAVPGVVTTEWTMSSGSGMVTFGDKFAVDTTASFSWPGIYVLRLTAYDGEYYNQDEVTITVNSSPVQNTWIPFIIK